MKILFIAPYPQGQAPSQRFRFEQYFPDLDHSNVRYRLVPFWSEKGWSILYRKGHFLQKFIQLKLGFIRRILLLFAVHKYDRVFIHREATPIGPPIIEWYISKVLNRKFCYDFDDAIWMSNTSRENKLATRLKFHNKVAAICRWADTVSCGNQWLADYAARYNNNVVVMPTTIDTNHHKPKDQTVNQNSITIGWTGTHSTGRYLYTLKHVLRKLHARYPIKFLMISNQPPENPDDFWRYERWEKANEIRQLQQMDIGIMPLENTDWEKGKCGFKALQYMAVGIPAIASPVGANNDIIEHGLNGYLCEGDDQWFQALETLILDPDKRLQMGGNGRRRVEQCYSNKANKNTFYEILNLDLNTSNIDD